MCDLRVVVEVGSYKTAVPVMFVQCITSFVNTKVSSSSFNILTQCFRSLIGKRLAGDRDEHEHVELREPILPFKVGWISRVNSVDGWVGIFCKSLDDFGGSRDGVVVEALCICVDEHLFACVDRRWQDAE